jgi:curved DNA-binding protein CbpA
MAHLKSLYDVLNVAPEAEPVVVEAAYKALIKKYHPDQAVGTPVSKDATAINEAFAVLKDPAKRADYDHRLWAKQQSIRLAEAQVASAGRPPRFVAVSGWLIAGLLAAALAALAMGRNVVSPRVTVAEAAEIHDSEAPARAAALKAAAAEAVHDRALPSSASVIARVRAEEGVGPAVVVRPSQPARAAAGAARVRKARPAARARTEPRKETDFHERQGYIY